MNSKYVVEELHYLIWYNWVLVPSFVLAMDQMTLEVEGLKISRFRPYEIKKVLRGGGAFPIGFAATKLAIGGGGAKYLG
jgi:hypothetical protein